MDGVKRYTYEVDDGAFAECVLGEDFEAALAREAALREELATSNKVGTAIGETLGRVTAERDDLHKRLTAVEQELARVNSAWHDMKQAGDIVKQRLTAAEQRNADQLKLIAGLVEYADNLLGDVNNAWSYAGNTGKPEVHKDDDYAAAVALIAKPTESGASDADCKADDEALQRRHDQERQEYFNDEQ